jgi:hypothetical protein
MYRSMVGLFAAVGAAMSAFVALAHGPVILTIMAIAAGAATGLAAYLALSPIQPSTPAPPPTPALFLAVLPSKKIL